MKKKDKINKESKNWIKVAFLSTFVLSITFGSLTNIILNKLNLVLALLILTLIILIGIVFDIIGTAIVSVNIGALTAKASRKQKGAKEAIKLIKNPDQVTNFCNDIIGDVCGIISGAMGAIISIRISNVLNFDIILVSLIIGSLIASITVGGKAIGKTIAIKNNINIVHRVGEIIHYLNKQS